MDRATRLAKNFNPKISLKIPVRNLTISCLSAQFSFLVTQSFQEAETSTECLTQTSNPIRPSVKNEMSSLQRQRQLSQKEALPFLPLLGYAILVVWL